MEAEEDEEEPTAAMAAANVVAYINNMNKEELIAYLEENLGDEFDPEHIREQLSGEEVEEYKRLLIAAMIPQQDGEEQQEEEPNQEEEEDEEEEEEVLNEQKQQEKNEDKAPLKVMATMTCDEMVATIMADQVSNETASAKASSQEVAPVPEKPRQLEDKERPEKPKKHDLVEQIEERVKKKKKRAIIDDDDDDDDDNKDDDDVVILKSAKIELPPTKTTTSEIKTTIKKEKVEEEDVVEIKQEKISIKDVVVKVEKDKDREREKEREKNKNKKRDRERREQEREQERKKQKEKDSKNLDNKHLLEKVKTEKLDKPAAEESSLLVSDNAKHKSLDPTQKEKEVEKSDSQPNISATKSVNLDDPVKEEITFPPKKLKPPSDIPYVDPGFHKYQKKFKLKICKVVLYDIKKQSCHWTEGDKVYRAQVREERRHAKKNKDKHGHGGGTANQYKYNERGVRVLDFEKRPESDRKKQREKFREIVREKPKTEAEKPNLFEVLHKNREKEMREKEEKRQKKLKMEFRIPIIKTEKDKAKETKHHSSYQEPVTTTTPSRQNKLKFDTRPLVTSTQRNDTWRMTPEEENAMKRQELRAIPDDDIMGPSAGDGFSLRDDDNLFDMKDDTGSGGDNPDSPGPPLIEISSDVNDVALNVLRLIETGKDVSPPREHASPTEVVEKKIAKWELNNQKEPYFQAVADIPENEEEEFYTLINAVDVTDDDDGSFYGNVSHPSGNGSDFLQDNEVSSSLDPDKADEYCGAGLLTAKYRIGGTGTASDKEDCFRLIFEVRRGFNYEKQNFQAKCSLCQGEFINGKRHLGAHVRSSKHRQNLAKLSLTLIGMDAKLSSKDSSKEVSRQRSSDSSHSSKNRDTKDKDKERSKDKGKEQDKNKDKDKTKLKVKEEKDRNGHKVSAATVAKDDKRSTKHAENKEGSGSSHTTLPPGTRVADASRNINRKRSRSRSRSPRARYADRTERSHRGYDRSRHHRGEGRSRSRSPHHGSRSRRTSSRDRVEAFLARNERSSSRRSPPPVKVIAAKAPRTKQDENMIFREKLTLQANGKWTPELEGRWKLMEDDEEQLKRLHTLKKRLMEEKPEEHPQYATEWEKFWERRYRELIDLGKTTEYADSYDYTTEWKEEWAKLTLQILLTEYDTRLHEIRIKYGMDLDTLKALNAPSRVPIAPTTVASHGNAPSYIPPGHATMPVASFALNSPPPGASLDATVYTSATNFSTPVPAPVVTTFLNIGQAGVYPSLTPRQPLLSDSLMTSVDRTNVPIVGTVLNKDTLTRNVDGVDYTPKSMSISDGGSVKSGSVKDTAPGPKVTVDDIKSTWLNLTGQKMSAAVAEAASKSVPSSQTAGSAASGSSTKEYDYDGFDVVQVLRLMCGLEDELSFLAPKVQESYRQAENMELEEVRSSFSLLKDREFVTLLFQCRDKFNSILRANVSTSEVMRKLNLTVYGMNALLDSPSCQKLRPTAATSINLTVDTARPESSIQKPASSLDQSNVADNMPSRKRDAENPIAAALSHLSIATKVALSSVVASSLIAQGKDRLSDSELLTNLLKIFAPVIASSVRSSSSSTAEVAYKKSNLNERGLSANDEMAPNRNRPVPSTSSSLPFKNDGFCYDQNLDRPRAVGISMQPGRSDPIAEPVPSRPTTSYRAIPPLPEFHARAVSPPAHKKFAMQQQAQQQSHGQNSHPLFVPNPLANPYHHGGGGSRRPPSPYDGRRPPAPLDQTKHEEKGHKKKRKRRSGSIHKSKKRHKRNKKRRDSPSNSSPSLIEQRRSSIDYKGRRSRSKSSEYDPLMQSRLSYSGSSSVISSGEIVRTKRHHRSRKEKTHVVPGCDDDGEKSRTLKDSKIAGVSKAFWDSERLTGASSCISSEENFRVNVVVHEKQRENTPPLSQEQQPPGKSKFQPLDKTKYRKTGTIPGETNPDDGGGTKEVDGGTKQVDGDAEEGEIISSSDTDFSNSAPRCPSPVGSNISFHVDTSIVNSYLFPRRQSPVGLNPAVNIDHSRANQNPLPPHRPSSMGSDISENWEVGMVDTNYGPRGNPRPPSPVGSNVSENWDQGIVKNDPLPRQLPRQLPHQLPRQLPHQLPHRIPHKIPRQLPRCPSPVDSDVSENWDLGIVK